MFAESLVNMFVAIFRALVHFSVCVSMCEYVFTIVHMCLSVFTLQTFLSVCVCVHIFAGIVPSLFSISLLHACSITFTCCLNQPGQLWFLSTVHPSPFQELWTFQVFNQPLDHWIPVPWTWLHIDDTQGWFSTTLCQSKVLIENPL